MSKVISFVFMFVIAVLLAFTCGCKTSQHTERMGFSSSLPKYDVLGVRDGRIILYDGRVIDFRRAIFTCNPKMIRIQSEAVHQTILWINIMEITIQNTRGNIKTDKNTKKRR